MVQVERPETFVADHTITPSDWMGQIVTNLLATAPWVFTAQGQMLYSIQEREMGVIDPPSSTAAHVLIGQQGQVPEWQLASTHVPTFLPDGSISRAKLAEDARLPALSEGAPKQYVRVNAEGTAYELVNPPSISAASTVVTLSSAGPGTSREAQIQGGYREDDLIVFAINHLANSSQSVSWRQFSQVSHRLNTGGRYGTPVLSRNTQPAFDLWAYSGAGRRTTRLFLFADVGPGTIGTFPGASVTVIRIRMVPT